MEVESILLERIKRFEDVKNQIADLTTKIGGLEEQRRAVYNKGLELKGSIDTLLEVKAKAAKEVEGSLTAKLTLPVGVKPIIPAVEAAPVVNVSPAPAIVPDAPAGAIPADSNEKPVEKAPVVLEVK